VTCTKPKDLYVNVRRGQKRKMINVGVSVYSLNDYLMRGKANLKECIEKIVGLGVDGIELVDWQLPNYPNPGSYDLRGLRKYVNSLGAKITCYDFHADFINLWHYPKLEDEVKRVKEEIAIADQLGAKTSRIFVYMFGPLPNGITPEKGYLRIKKALNMCLPTAEEYNIPMGLEIHPGFYYHSPKWCLKFVEDIGSEYLKLVPDFSYWAKVTDAVSGMGRFKDVPASLDIFKRCVPYSIHIHGKVYSLSEEGEEPQIPCKTLISLLKKGGYDGYISIEYEGYCTNPDLDSLKETKKCVDLIRKHI